MDLIDRQAAIDALKAKAVPLYKDPGCSDIWERDRTLDNAIDVIRGLPSAQPEPHYCRECKWSRCHTNVDKHGETETYWRCLNWDGGTDEEGFCHEWERRANETN